MLSDLRLTAGYWYLATVYTKHPKGLDDAARVASELAGQLLLVDIPVFCPIAHTHPIARAAGIDPLYHPFWMEADRPMMRAAHGLLVATMDGWASSRGITEEIAEFHKAGKPIFTVDPATLTIGKL